MMALYPATVAMDESASIDCARLMRGTNSMLNRVTGSAMAVAKASRSIEGLRKPMTTAPGLSHGLIGGLRAFTNGSRSACARMIADPR